uniref:Farnesol dehydrogenase n=1 Tax=Cacopsylla melanoneura TaxID=428564 RepID=A0A8D9E8E1_9HEMI
MECNVHSIRSRYQSMKDGSSWYSASKHAVGVLTDGLRRELASKKSRIKVSSLNPGGVLTEIFEKGHIHRDPEAPALTAKDVADSVIHVIGTPPNVQISELTIIPVQQYNM